MSHLSEVDRLMLRHVAERTATSLRAALDDVDRIRTWLDQHPDTTTTTSTTTTRQEHDS